jgi:hypothetical protein
MAVGSDLIWDKLTDLSIVAGMNQRYSQQMMTDAENYAHLVDAFVVFSTMLCLAVAIVAYFVPESTFANWRLLSKVRFDLLAVILAFASAVAGILLVVLPASRDANHYSRMFQSWSDLRQDVDSAIADADAEKSTAGDGEQTYLERRYRDLLAKKNELNAREPAADQDLLSHFLELEETARGSKDEKSKSG